MFITTHAALGALIGEQFPGHPWIAFVLALASHFLSDIIPHGDSDLYKGYIAGSKVRRAIAYVIIDGIAALCLVMYLLTQDKFTDKRTVSLAIFAGVLPDLLVASYELVKIRILRAFTKLHFFFHNMITDRKGDMSFSWGLVTQTIILLLILTKLVPGS